MLANIMEQLQELLSALESQLLVETTTEQSKILGDISKAISILIGLRHSVTLTVREGIL